MTRQVGVIRFRFVHFTAGGFMTDVVFGGSPTDLIGFEPCPFLDQ